MLAVSGTYLNGFVKLDKDYISDNPVKVIVTFLEEVEPKNETHIALSDFSFAKSQSNLQHYKGSFADEVIQERRESL